MVEVSPNPGHWNFENIHLEGVRSDYPIESAVLAYERGQGDQRLDWVSSPCCRSSPVPGGSGALRAAPASMSTRDLDAGASNGQEPFQNDEVGLKVRRALSHAVDRSRSVELTNGLAIEAFGMVPTGVFGYIDDPEIAAIQAFDPALAMEQLVGTPYEGGQNWPEITMHMRGQEEPSTPT